MDKKSRIIATATKIFLQKGFAATSVDEIIEAAGVSKGSVFYHFQNKVGLAQAVIKAYYRDMQQALSHTEVSDGYDLADPVINLHNYLNNIVQQISTGKMNSKSLLGAFALEVADTEPTIAATLQELYQDWLQGYKHMLDKVFIGYSVIDTYSLSLQLVSLLEGGMVLLHATAATPGSLLMNMKSYQHYISLLIEGSRCKL